MTLLQSIWTAERAVGDRTEFSEAVAKGLYKFTAYKDEYEVARLLTDPQFLSYVKSEVPAGENLTCSLHPPVLRAMGRKKKIGLGPRSHVALRILAKGKRLRGTKFDPFSATRTSGGSSAACSQSTSMSLLAAELEPINYDRAVEVAGLADMVRGYEDVKLASVEAYHARLSELGITASD